MVSIYTHRINYRSLKTCLLFLGMSLQLACFETVLSSDVLTSEVYMTAQISIAQNVGTVDVVLRSEGVNSSNYISLVEKDELFLRSETIDLEEKFQEEGPPARYFANFQTPLESALFHIEFQRKGVVESRSEILVLPPLEFVAPSWGEIRRAESGFELRWQPRNIDANVQIFLQGACIQTVQVEAALNVGLYRFTPESYAFMQPEDALGCDVEIIAQVENEGILDPIHPEGSILSLSESRTRIRLEVASLF